MALGCETHTAFIYDRGGITRIAPITDVLSVSWERVRDDIGSGRVLVSNPTPECARMLAGLSTARHELVIYRGAQRVWEGPLTRIAYHRSHVVLEARDVMHYAYRTVLRKEYDNSTTKATTCIQRALNMMSGEMNRKEALSPPANVLPHVRALFAEGDSRTSAKTLPYQSTVFEQIDSMAAKSGMDYAVMGRSILLFDTHTIIGVAPQMTENDFVGDVIVTEYGMEMATFAAVTDGKGGYGKAGVDVDPYYGNWEILHTAYQEEGAEAPTQNELTSQAVRNLDGRNPAPVDVRIPDGSRLNPKGAWSIQDLVPGVRIPLVATFTARTVSQMQKLDRVAVTDGPEGEAVMVTLSPASQNDSPIIEEGDPGSQV